jgi:hypothetical protein
MNYTFSDIELARRLERAEGRSNADFVEARARVQPDSGAQWIEVAGAYAMFDGVQSPLTQTFGLGMFQPLTIDDLERIESFFNQHAAPILHEVSPLADPSVVSLLNDRHYQPFEFTSVMSRPIDPAVRVNASPNPRMHIRVVNRGQPSEQDLWARTAARGWGETPELGEFMLALAQVGARCDNAVSFFAELEGTPIATGGLSIQQGVALLAGASTVPAGRKQGAQLALLEHRLRYAAEHGCDLAMMGALPGSASQRNAERQGFRIAYTRIKWRSPGHQVPPHA